jgi:hypothetical protein
MFLILADVTGFLAAFIIHGVTWYARRNYLPLTVVAGILSALGLTIFCLLFLNSDIASMMLIVLVIFWLVALALGYWQARSLAVAWWKGVMGVFFEMAVTFLIGAFVNLTLQRYIEWLNEQFPGMDVYAIINSFLWVMIITLLVLAVLRPLLLLKKARTGQ